MQRRLGSYLVVAVLSSIITHRLTRCTTLPGNASTTTTSKMPIVPLESIPSSPVQREGGAQSPGFEEKLDTFFGHKTGLFFIESGAFDGIGLSNTVWLERSKDWHGLLVEGNPNLAQKIRKESGRTKSKLLDGCLSTSTQVQQVNFTLAGPLGGIAAAMDKKHTTRIESEIKQNESWMQESNVGKSVKVTCYPLNSILKAMGITVVDFWSLDTEGSEVQILQTVDFKTVLFGLLFIESNTRAHREKVVKFMTSQGFVENKALAGNQDTAWNDPRYCQQFQCGM